MLTMTSGTGKNSWLEATRARATTSVPPPAENPTTILIGFSGTHSAAAGELLSETTAQVAIAIFFQYFILFPPVGCSEYHRCETAILATILSAFFMASGAATPLPNMS